MKTKTIFSAILMMFLFLAGNFAKAQDEKVIKDFTGMSLEQLQQHRSQLIEMNSSQNLQEKLMKLNGKVPSDCGIEAVDKITALLGNMMGKLQQNRTALSSMYSGVTGLNMDGTPATLSQVDSQQLNGLVTMLTQMSGEILGTAKSLVTLPSEIKSAGYLKALKGLKNLLYIKDAVGAVKAELQYDNQMAQNLLATQRLMAAGK